MWQNYSAPSLHQVSNPNKRFPVLRTHATLHCSQGLARLRVTQLFHNSDDHPVECCYVLKSLSEAVLTSIRAQLANEVIKFRVKEKEKAKEDYADAISSGRTAILASTDEDSITLQLGMVPGQTDMEITLKLIYAMEYRLDHWRCTVSKAFFPPPPKSKQEMVKKTLRLDMEIEEVEAILAVSSPSHKIISSVTGANAVVQLAPQKHDTGLDLILEYQTAANSPYIVRVEHDEKLGENVAALGYRLSPASETQISTGEYVFLLDRSGSMGAVKMEMLKEAMTFLLKSLPTDCKFNIFSFGSAFEELFTVSQPYSDQTTQQALSAISQFEANLGGTQLLPALQQILSAPTEDLYPRNVVLLTDGQVEDGSPVYELLRKHKEKTRFHAIGLGQDVSEKWLQSVGVLTKGGFEVVKKVADLAASLVVFLERVLAPSVTGIEVIWPGNEWISAPNTVRNVYEGDMVFMYANYGDREVTGNVVFRYTNTASKQKEEVAIALPVAVKGKSLGKMWAFHRISDLPVVSEATAVSLKYQVPSPHTAFIGVSSQATDSTLPMLSFTPIAQPYCGARVMARSRKTGMGGRGLGKCGAKKRHRRCVRESIEGITKPAIRRLSRKGSVKRTSRMATEESRNVLRTFLDKALRDAVTYTEHAGRRTVTALDVVLGLKGQNTNLYGFGGRGLMRHKMVTKRARDSLDESDSDQDLLTPRSRSRSPTKSPKLVAARATKRISQQKPQSAADTGSLLWFIYAQSTAGYWAMSSVRDGLKAVPIPRELLQFGPQAEDIWATLMVVFLLSTRFASDSQKTSLLLRKAKAWLSSLLVRYEDFLPALQAAA